MALRDEFEAVSRASIEDYVIQGREEDLHLDFKTVANPGLASDDRRSLAIAVSGFANSDGGLIVWGVEARKNADGVDCAVSTQEISNARLCLTRLNDLTGQAVSPLVDGVDHRLIPTESGGGFCVSIIPASQGGPHMAKLREDRYYKRNGSAFHRLEHFDLEDLFGRRPKPVLRFKYRLIGSGGSSSSAGKVYGGAMIVGLENNGRGSAHFPYLTLRVRPPHQVCEWGLDGNGNVGLRKLASSSPEVHRYAATADTVIHPGVVHEVTRVKFNIRADAAGRLEPVPDLELEFEMAAQGIPLIRAQVVVPAAELVGTAVPAK
jgi:hypothetical protein